jgi:hypothetical protein
VLGPVELLVFKVMFDRSLDWADVEAAMDAGRVDPDEVRDALGALLAPDDPRLERLAELERSFG